MKSVTAAEIEKYKKPHKVPIAKCNIVCCHFERKNRMPISE